MATTKKRKPTRDELKRGECLCDHCSAKCCRYFALPIETPTNWDDYDSIRWYLAHGKTLVYTETKKGKTVWYLVVMSDCNYLTKDGRCGIYYNRPKICKDYSTDVCEYDTDWGFEKVFETPEQIWEYAEAVLPPRRRKKAPANPLVVLGQGVEA